MPTVSRTFTVRADPQTVLNYLRDFAHAEQWDPAMQRCTRINDGPLRVGARWHVVSRILGRQSELDYQLKQATPSMLVFEGRNDATTATETVVVTPVPVGATVSYRSQLKLHGAAALLSPAMKLLFERIAGQTRDQMIAVLNSLPGESGR